MNEYLFYQLNVVPNPKTLLGKGKRLFNILQIIWDPFQRNFF